MPKQGIRSLIQLFVFACALTGVDAAHAQNSCGNNALPSPLPLDGQAIANTCMPDANPVCSAASFPYRTSSARLVLTEPSAVNLTLAGGDPTFSPMPYVTGGDCDKGGCGEILPAGEYCLIVTADPASALGSCGCFNLLVETASDRVFADSFD